MNLAAHKKVAPPPKLLAVMDILEKTENFVVLPSSVKAQPWRLNPADALRRLPVLRQATHGIES